MVNNPWKCFETNVCFSFRIFWNCWSKRSKASIWLFFCFRHHAAFFFKLISCGRFFFLFFFWHYFKSIAKDLQRAINPASGQCESGSLLEVNCIPLNCTNVLTSSWKTNFHHPLTHSYPRLLKTKKFLVNISIFYKHGKI